MSYENILKNIKRNGYCDIQGWQKKILEDMGYHVSRVPLYDVKGEYITTVFTACGRMK